MYKKLIFIIVTHLIVNMHVFASSSSNAANSGRLLKKEEIKEVLLKNLEKMKKKKVDWHVRKKVVETLVVNYQIHPDSLQMFENKKHCNRIPAPIRGYLDYLPYPDDLVLKEAVCENDIPFATFLLKHGADPKNKIYHYPDQLIANYARSQEMTDLLIQYGGQRDELSLSAKNEDKLHMRQIISLLARRHN